MKEYKAVFLIGLAAIILLSVFAPKVQSPTFNETRFSAAVQAAVRAELDRTMVTLPDGTTIKFEPTSP
jgi:hypothetical protein